MADVNLSSGHQSTMVTIDTGSGSDQLDEAPAKKMRKLFEKTDLSNTNEKGMKAMERLENRLGGILCCAVCLDLPNSAVFQCTNGHLMCVGCFNHLLADARMRDETATCPNCRTEISKNLSSRNLAVEKAVSELPAQCQYCGHEYSRNTLQKHEKELCEERTTMCKFNRIGCQWRGPFHEAVVHESTCVHPHRSGGDLMDYLFTVDEEHNNEKKLYATLFDLLSFEKIAFNDVQLKSYRTDEFIHKLYYETSRFYAFSHQWVIKARLNGDQKDPTQSSERSISYQLTLKSKTTSPLTLYFLMLHGPFGEMQVLPKIYHFEFTETTCESPLVAFPLRDSAECNKVLSGKAINCRLIMFMCPK